MQLIRYFIILYTLKNLESFGLGLYFLSLLLHVIDIAHTLKYNQM